ncbi:hypothetical protein BYT27DRAFT_7182311 [Phlegmacium glaucopus]|nr:hypothetical protein BYT27DRAFT_7182311 [Phlegmacium glaucopus]
MAQQLLTPHPTSPHSFHRPQQAPNAITYPPPNKGTKKQPNDENPDTRAPKKTSENLLAPLLVVHRGYYRR